MSDSNPGPELEERKQDRREGGDGARIAYIYPRAEKNVSHLSHLLRTCNPPPPQNYLCLTPSTDKQVYFNSRKQSIECAEKAMENI